MTDKQLESVIRTWLHGTDRPPADSRRSAGQVMARLPEREHRRRWWPFLREASSVSESPTTDRKTEYQPSPIPATNGHAPTVIGRTQTMFSPINAITAGVLVFAIGGVMLIAQPFDQQRGNVPGAASDDERVAPVEFTGRWHFGSQRLPGSRDTSDPRFVRDEGGAWFHTALNVTDPRFDGEVTIFANSDDYANSTGNYVYHDVWRVENADGAWQSEPSYNVGFADGSGTGLVAVFHGEGGYEGLVAVVELDADDVGWDLRGVIFDGDLPPEPAPQPLP